MGMGKGVVSMNKTLLAGLILTTAIIGVAIFGKFFIRHDLDEPLKIHYAVDSSGKGTIVAPPLPPGKDYPIGTDYYGYDLMTRILVGAKYTIFLAVAIAFARVFFGGIAGMLLGYFARKPAKRREPATTWKLLNGIPIFLVIWLLLAGLSINSSLSPIRLCVVMGAVLAAVGIPSVVISIKEKTELIREKPFILAARSIGTGHRKMIGAHLFPHLKDSFLILIVQEIVLVLTLFGQLAIFHLFVGGTVMTFDPIEYNSRTNEWAGLIAAGRSSLDVYPWILFVPLAAYLVLILGFQLLARGLQTLFNQKYTKPSRL